jgi:hypothetical protein
MQRQIYNTTEKKHEPLTMYKNNSRDCSKFNGCSPLQFSCNLTGKCYAVGYYSYTKRWPILENRTANEIHIFNTDFFDFTFSLRTG